MPVPLLVPREHGAWAMLLLPFFSALALAREISWEALPAAVVVVGVFLIREPLVALWRQARVWREQARRSLIWYLPPIAASGLILLWRRPFWPLLITGAAAALLIVVSTYLVVHKRPRSLLLQMVSAGGLNASALVAWLAVRAQFDPTIWWLWALHFAHSGAALLAVHARLEARVAARTGSEWAAMKKRATAAQTLLLAAAAGCVAAGRLGAALALGLSASVHLADLARLQDSVFLRTPLRRVGLRELALSFVFSVVVLAGLW